MTFHLVHNMQQLRLGDNCLQDGYVIKAKSRPGEWYFFFLLSYTIGHKYSDMIKYLNGRGD